MRWCDLLNGDRVRHVEYGEGRIDYAGPNWLIIIWDDPTVASMHQPSEMVQHLTRVE